MISKIESYLQEAIDRGVFPGSVLGIIIGEKRFVVARGRFTYDSLSPEMNEDTLFDCASITKAIPVSSLALQFIDEQRIGLADPLIKYIPEFNGSYREQVQIKHLLTHTLNFDFRLSDCKDLPSKEILNLILSIKMKSPPGTNFFYANATSILLGLVLERAGGKSLPELAQERIFEPLGMSMSTFFPERSSFVAVPTEEDSWRGRIIQGEVHDESAWALRSLLVAGSAGLFSTVPDLLSFMSVMLGVSGNKQLFSRSVLDKVQTNQIPHIKDKETGLGWELNQPYMGKRRTATTFGKTGFTGCAIIADRSKNVALVHLSNYTWPKRKSDRSLINEVRSDLADIVFEMAR